MIRRLRNGAAGRLAAAVLGLLVLQLTAVSHLHVAHQGPVQGASVALPDGSPAFAADPSRSADHGLPCPICLIRAQSNSFAVTGVIHTTNGPTGIDGFPPATVAPPASIDAGIANPRGPPAFFS
jgi:hypothetical protein